MEERILFSRDVPGGIVLVRLYKPKVMVASELMADAEYRACKSRDAVWLLDSDGSVVCEIEFISTN